MSDQQTANPPIATLRDGAVFTKIWRNPNHESGDIYYNVTVGRIYTEKETGNVRETRSLSPNDILKLQPLLSRAYEAISQERAQDREYAAQAPQQGLESQRDAALSQTSKPQPPKPVNTPVRSRQPER